MAAFEHLCQTKGRTSAVLVLPKSCCSKKVAKKTTCAKSSCCSKKKQSKLPTLRKKPCCEDRTHFLKADYAGTPLQLLEETNTSLQVAFAAISSSQRHTAVPVGNLKLLRFYLYKPPPNTDDLRVLLQSFLC